MGKESMIRNNGDSQMYVVLSEDQKRENIASVVEITAGVFFDVSLLHIWGEEIFAD